MSFARTPEILRLPYVVLVVSLLITLAATYIFYQSSDAKDKIRFQNEASKINATIENRINVYVAMLRAGRGFLKSGGAVTRQSFSSFIGSMDLAKNYTGVRALGYAVRILPGGRESLIRKMSEEGTANFKIFPDKGTENYSSIIYIEPVDEQNQSVIGFDMYSEPIRREAMIRARDEAKPVASGKIFLLQDTESNRTPGFIIYLPVYGREEIPASIEEREKQIEGFVYSPFRGADFLNDVQKFTQFTDISVKIYDREIDQENLLAQSAADQSIAANRYESFTDLDIAGRNWAINYNTLPSFEIGSSRGWTPYIFISGLICSLLLFGLTFAESLARSRAERTTAFLSASEKEKAQLLESEQRARIAAEDSNRAKDEFIAVVSHELRTPLNSIAGWTRILKTGQIAPNVKTQAIETIERNLRVQTKIIEDLLDFSQIITGNEDLRREIYNFSDIFEEALQKIRPDAESKGVILDGRNTLNGQKILGDYERLAKVIENLLVNAIKFTPTGGNIIAEATEKKGRIEICITDTGQGINSAFLPHVFEHFRQADSSTTRRHGGLGLGLALSKLVIEKHGGSIEAASEGEGKGASFIVKLPFQK